MLYKGDEIPQHLQAAGTQPTPEHGFFIVDQVMTDTIGQRMRIARHARGLTQVDIAEVCDISRAAVSQWEKDETVPRISYLEKAADRLRVSLEWLRTGKGPAPDLRIKPVVGRRRLVPVREEEQPRPAPLTSDAIPEQALGIGSGPLTFDGRVHDWWRLPAGLVSETLRSQPHYLVMLRVLSDSMEPTIKRHDFVLIDQSQITARHGDIFAIDNGIGVILRRLLVNDGDVTLRADRDHEQDVTVKLDAIRLIGRCLGAFVIF